MNTLKGKKVTFDDSYLNVELSNGRIISTPLNWYPALKKATVTQLKNYSFICRNTGIEWSGLDYHLSIEAMILGKKVGKHRAA
ncbi:MAG: DUF2442 domain-containing protein [Bacteroidota bacterium]